MTDKPTKILVVDDESEIRNMLNIFLGTEDFEVIESATGKEAIRSAVSNRPDLVLLDLGLPDMDGKEIISSLRKWTNVPVIVLTARTDDDQAVQALNLGADDYVTKPFRAEILLARIHANLRLRTRSAPASEALSNGRLRLDLRRHEAFIGDVKVAFTPKEYALVRFFVETRGKIVTHKQILKVVWGPAHVDDTQYLRVYIGQVREKLEKAGNLGSVITSESGIGYRMEIVPDDMLVAAE